MRQGQFSSGFAPSPQTLLAAKTVFVVADALVLDPTSKAVQTLKKALVKWGRFRVVDDAETADLIIVISEYSSSKPTRMERISEGLAIFAAGSTSCADATPLWAVREVGPALGQRPTGKLVEDLEKELAKLEKPVHASAAPSPDMNWLWLTCAMAVPNGQAFFTNRVIQIKITAPTNATMMEPIIPPPGQT